MYIVDRKLPFVCADTKWSEEHNTWYAGDDVLQKMGHSTIFSPYYELHSSAICWKCGNITPVVTLGVTKVVHHNIPHGIEHSHPQNIIICYEMSQLPDDIIAYFCQFDCFGRVFTKKQGQYWGNKCIRCGIVQGEYYLGLDNIDGGPFASTSPAENKRIEVIKELTGRRIATLAVTFDDAFRRPEFDSEFPSELPFMAIKSTLYRLAKAVLKMCSR